MEGGKKGKGKVFERYIGQLFCSLYLRDSYMDQQKLQKFKFVIKRVEYNNDIIQNNIVNIEEGKVI